MSSRFLLWLAGRRPEREIELARASQRSDEAALQAVLDEDQARFQATMTERASERHIVLGTTAKGVPYRLPLTDLSGVFSWVSAATGSGKSRFICAVLMQLVDALIAGASVSIVLVDMKGELAEIFLRALTARLATLAPAARERIITQLIPVLFFSGQYLPEWQLLARNPSVSLIAQAQAMAEALEAASADLGIRQSTALTAILALAIEGGLSLAEARYLVHSPERLRSLAEKSALPEARLYVQTRLARENVATTLDGVAARLDTLLRVDAIKALAAGPSALDLRRAFTPGTITVFGFGGVPLGTETAKKILGATAFTHVTWSAFDPARERRGFTVIFADELQEALSAPSTLHHVERLVTTGRSFGVGLWSAHQSVAQLPSSAQSILASNVRLRVLGRSGESDAKSAAEWLPRTGRVLRSRLPGEPPPERPQFLSEGEELRRRIADLGKLPGQHFLVADRLAPFGAQLVRAPHCAPPEWGELDPGLVDAVLRGSVGRPRAELIERARELELKAAEALTAEAPPARGTRGSEERPPKLPDINAVEAEKRARRGRMP